jgi:hypothetical protein
MAPAACAGGRCRAQYQDFTFPLTATSIVVQLVSVPGYDQATIKGLEVYYVGSSTYSLLGDPPSHVFDPVNPNDPQNNKWNFTITVSRWGVGALGHRVLVTCLKPVKLNAVVAWCQLGDWRGQPLAWHADTS